METLKTQLACKHTHKIMVIAMIFIMTMMTLRIGKDDDVEIEMMHKMMMMMMHKMMIML